LGFRDRGAQGIVVGMTPPAVALQASRTCDGREKSTLNSNVKECDSCL